MAYESRWVLAGVFRGYISRWGDALYRVLPFWTDWEVSQWITRVGAVGQEEGHSK